MTPSHPTQMDRQSGDGECEAYDRSMGAFFLADGTPRPEEEPDYTCSSCNGTGDGGIPRGPGYSFPCGACGGTGTENVPEQLHAAIALATKEQS